MEKEREVKLEELIHFKEDVMQNLEHKQGFENVKKENVNIKHFNKKVELVHKITGEKELFDLHVVEIYDDSHQQIVDRLYYLNGKEVDFEELLRIFESPMPIKDAVDKSEENKRKPKKEQDKELEIQDLDELEKEKASKEKNKDKIQQKDEKDQKEEKILTSDTSGATSLDQQVDRVSLRNILDLEADDDYIKPISKEEASKKYGEHPNTKDVFEVIKKDGTSRLANEDILKQDRQEGNNSFDQDLNANVDGNLEYKSNTSSFEIVNKPGYYLSVGYDKGSMNREIKIEKRSRINTKEGLEEELIKKGASEYQDPNQRNQTRRNEEGRDESDEVITHQKEHEKLGCENDRIENIDTNQENDLHQHFDSNAIIPGTDVTWKELAEKTEEGIDKLQERFVRESKHESDPNKIVKNIEEDYGRLNNHNHNL